jgi:glycosyltransferase involved in cell wall biosynthesis
MRILFLQDHFEIGGAARAAGRYRALVKKLGYTTAVACGDGTGSPEVFSLQGKMPRGAGRILQLCLPLSMRRRWMEARVAKAWRHCLDRFRPVCVWAHNLHGAYKWGWSPGMLASAQGRIPVVWTLHDMALLGDGETYWPESEWRTRSAGSAFRKIFAEASPSHLQLTAPSVWMAELANRCTGRSCQALSNPIDLTTFQPGDREEARKKLGLPRNAPVFLAGAERVDDPRKGLSLLEGLRDAFRQAGITLAMFGRNGRPQTGQVYLGVLRDEKEAAEAYRAADLYLHLAHQENAPCQIQEALACGTPVLAFSVGGIPEMVREGETGFLVSWDERAHLGGCLREKILRKKNNLSTMRDSCRRDAVGRYSEENLGPKLQELLGRLTR